LGIGQQTGSPIFLIVPIHLFLLVWQPIQGALQAEKRQNANRWGIFAKFLLIVLI